MKCNKVLKRLFLVLCFACVIQSDGLGMGRIIVDDHDHLQSAEELASPEFKEFQQMGLDVSIEKDTLFALGISRLMTKFFMGLFASGLCLIPLLESGDSLRGEQKNKEIDGILDNVFGKMSKLVAAKNTPASRSRYSEAALVAGIIPAIFCLVDLAVRKKDQTLPSLQKLQKYVETLSPEQKTKISELLKKSTLLNKDGADLFKLSGCNSPRLA